MKKNKAIERIMYIINPRKSLKEFLNEAENIVNNYEKYPMDSVFKIYTSVKPKKSGYDFSGLLLLMVISVCMLIGYCMYRIII